MRVPDEQLSDSATDGEGEDDGSSQDEGGGTRTPSQVSDTNNQVADVDEADMVKSDVGHLYVASQGALHVLEAWPAANTREIARLKLEGEPRKLFVENGRAVVYSSLGGNGSACTYGYDCDFTGDGSRTRLSVLDVSEPSAPRVSSEALTNHLAFNYFAPKQLLALPMTICEGGDGGSFGSTMTFSGLMLFGVNLETGFQERGRVAHPPLSTGSYDDSACGNWWTQASSVVKRSVFMDDFVYSIAEDVVRVQSLTSLGSDLASVPLAAPTCTVNGQTYRHGDSVYESGDCCSCRDGKVECDAEACDFYEG